MKLIRRFIALKMSILRVDAAIINPKTVKPNVCPTLTSRVDKKLSLPTHVLLDQNPGLKVPSIVQLEQIFTIDKRRVQRFAGQTSSEEMDRIEVALKISLAMN